MGQRSPDTAIAVAVEDGINHGPHLGLAWPPTGAGRWQEGLQDRPLLACQITGVWLRVHTLSTFETPFWNRLLAPILGKASRDRPKTPIRDLTGPEVLTRQIRSRGYDLRHPIVFQDSPDLLYLPIDLWLTFSRGSVLDQRMRGSGLERSERIQAGERIPEEPTRRGGRRGTTSLARLAISNIPGS